jgi:beta-1,4-mannosyltransferase
VASQISVEPIQVAFLPAATEEPDAYIRLLRDALAARGVGDIVLPGSSRAWTEFSAQDLSVVHLHWLEFIAPSDRRRVTGSLRTAIRVRRFLKALRMLRRRGVAIVWTVHNAAPHEPRHRRLERWLWNTVRASSDQIIVHSTHAAGVVSTDAARSKVQVIHHGNYVQVYRSSGRPRAILRQAYGLGDRAFTYLAFGQLRRYKRIPELLETFRKLPNQDAALLVAGEPRDRAEAEQVRALARRDDRVRLELRRIPFAEVADLHEACDAAVLPYETMFSSGAAVLALSMRLPIIVPADSAGANLAGPPAVITYAQGELGPALVAVRRGDQRSRRQAAADAVHADTWPSVAERTIETYESALRVTAARRRT